MWEEIDAERALQKAIDEERAVDPNFDAKVHAWNALMELHNKTGKSPMELAETPDGQKVLDNINAKVGATMTKMFGG
jgi:hypothetical protein